MPRSLRSAPRGGLRSPSAGFLLRRPEVDGYLRNAPKLAPEFLTHGTRSVLGVTRESLSLGHFQFLNSLQGDPLDKNKKSQQVQRSQNLMACKKEERALIQRGLRSQLGKDQYNNNED